MDGCVYICTSMINSVCDVNFILILIYIVFIFICYFYSL